MEAKIIIGFMFVDCVAAGAVGELVVVKGDVELDTIVVGTSVAVTGVELFNAGGFVTVWNMLAVSKDGVKIEAVDGFVNEEVALDVCVAVVTLVTFPIIKGSTVYKDDVVAVDNVESGSSVVEKVVMRDTVDVEVAVCNVTGTSGISVVVMGISGVNVLVAISDVG